MRGFQPSEPLQPGHYHDNLRSFPSARKKNRESTKTLEQHFTLKLGSLMQSWNQGTFLLQLIYSYVYTIMFLPLTQLICSLYTWNIILPLSIRLTPKCSSPLFISFIDTLFLVFCFSKDHTLSFVRPSFSLLLESPSPFHFSILRFPDLCHFFILSSHSFISTPFFPCTFFFSLSLSSLCSNI